MGTSYSMATSQSLVFHNGYIMGKFSSYIKFMIITYMTIIIQLLHYSIIYYSYTSDLINSFLEPSLCHCQEIPEFLVLRIIRSGDRFWNILKQKIVVTTGLFLCLYCAQLHCTWWQCQTILSIKLLSFIHGLLLSICQSYPLNKNS